MVAALRDGAIPEPVLEVCRTLEGAGFRSWVVGGCIRDLLMGRVVSDWDLATTALPRDVQRTFRRTIPTGIDHGTVTVLHRGEAYEITTLRGEGAYSDGRRPDDVEFVGDIEEDLARRDFTVNAIAFDPLTAELVDPWGGLADLDAGVIRAVRDPAERFGEDGLRVLRGARFCATLGLELEPATEAAIPASLPTFRKVSAERVTEEWRKALVRSGVPSRAFVVMRRAGILAITCEPLAALTDAAFEASMMRMDRAAPSFDLRVAALLLDVARAPTPTRDAAWVDAWLRGMRVSNQERKSVLGLVEHGRLPASDATAPPALRRWLRAVGRDALDGVFALARADGQDVDELRARADAELASGLPLEPKELPINGGDVMAALDSAPGRAVGQVLERLLEDVFEDPSLLARDSLLARIPDAFDAVRSA